MGEKNNLVLVVGAIVAFVLQIALAPAVALFQAQPNFLLAYALVVAIVIPTQAGPVLPFIMGLLYDLTGTGPVGGMALLLVIACFLASRVFSLMDNDTLFMPLVMALGSISTALALSRGGSLVFAGAMGFGTLAAFISYTTQLFDPIQQLARILAEMQSAQASAERVIDLLDTQPDIVDSPEVEAEYGTAFAPRRGNWPPIAGGVEFRDVTFAYKTGETVLRDFNLKVEPGQTIALVGETGAGKSTIVNLVCRFYEPTAGQVLIDGVDYRERSQLWLHSALGYVLQTPHLFSGSIADNIRYGRKDATLDEVKRAAAMVRADRFIEALPDGYGTEVGEGGGRLSTGQKQLVCFARVVLSDPRIFVLDEATSSIDTETEQLIQNAIQTVLTGRTSFIVAHRLSTIQTADVILVMNQGDVIEQGTHEELLARGGFYARLYRSQFEQ